MGSPGEVGTMKDIWFHVTRSAAVVALVAAALATAAEAAATAGALRGAPRQRDGTWDLASAGIDNIREDKLAGSNGGAGEVTIPREAQERRRAANQGGALGQSSRGAGADDGGIIDGGPSAERVALEELYNATGGPAWFNNLGWLQGEPCPLQGASTWVGVTCSLGRVSALSVSNNNLVGTLPAGLFNGLPQLTSLSIGGNVGLIGPLSPSLANLTKLTSLQAQSSRFSTSLPELLSMLAAPSLPSVQQLSLERGAWTGDVTASLSKLFQLNQLVLANNPQLRVNATTLFNTLAAASNEQPVIQYVDISNTGAVGTLPQSLASLSLLNQLALSGNVGLLSNLDELATLLAWKQGGVPQITALFLSDMGLSGTLPKEFSQLEQLAELDLSGNSDLRITLSDAKQLGSSLGSLSMSRCHLRGTLPDLSSLSSLQSLDVSNNYLSGTLPESWPTQFQVLQINGNDMGHQPTLPSVFQRLPLRELTVSDNPELRPNVTSWIESLTSVQHTGSLYLQSFSLANTNAVGTIPESFSKLPVEVLDISGLESGLSELVRALAPSGGGVLRYLTARHQRGSSFPAGLHELVRLSHLDVSDSPEMLNVSLHNSVSLTELGTLNVAGSGHTGSFPLSLLQPPNLAFINISNTPGLTGSLPKLATTHPRIAALDASNCSLSGTIPAFSERTARRFALFSLSDNTGISGPLPASLTCCADHLESLMLSGCSLSGSLPDDWTGMPQLRNALLANNANLGGTIDSSVFFALPGLQNLDLSHLSLRGSVPPLPLPIPSPLPLQFLAVTSSGLSGTLPTRIFELPYLTTLLGAVNSFTGPLPSRLPPELKTLDLSFNNFNGSVPSWSSSALRTLHLSHNLLDGTLPASAVPWDAIESYHVSLNRLSGSLPEVSDSDASPALRNSSQANLEVMAGNLFACPIDGVFVDDSFADDYVCAGVEAELVPIAVGGAATVFFVVALCVHRTVDRHDVGAAKPLKRKTVKGPRYRPSLRSLLDGPQVGSKGAVAHEVGAYAAFLRNSLRLVLKSCVAACVLSVLYGTLPAKVTHRYALTITAAFAGDGSSGFLDWLMAAVLVTLAITTWSFTSRLIIARLAARRAAAHRAAQDAFANRNWSGLRVPTSTDERSASAASSQSSSESSSSSSSSDSDSSGSSSADEAKPIGGVAVARQQHLGGVVFPSTKRVAAVPGGVQDGDTTPRMSWLIVALAVVVCASPNVAFVVVSHADAVPATVKQLIKAAMSVLKALLNVVGLPAFAAWAAGSRRSSHVADSYTTLAAVLIHVNTLLIPIFSVLLFNPRCFLYAWRPPAEVVTSVEVSECQWSVSCFSDNGCPPASYVPTCEQQVPREVTSTVQYPWRWNDSCPSSLLELYGGVWVSSTLLAGAAVGGVRLGSRTCRRRFTTWARPNLYELYTRAYNFVDIAVVLGPVYPAAALAALIALAAQTITDASLAMPASAVDGSMGLPPPALAMTLLSQGVMVTFVMSAGDVSGGVSDFGVVVVWLSTFAALWEMQNLIARGGSRTQSTR